MRESLGVKPKGAMKVSGVPPLGGRPAGRMGIPYVHSDGAPHSRGVSFSSRVETHQERTRWYPKDGELCLARTKPGETLVEVRSDSDVQIDRLSWV